MYSISGYGEMIADSVRMDAYTLALRRAIQPSSVVLDIGSGTGILALLACRYGARRVYAVEPDNAIAVAETLAAANGCADRIRFIQELSTRVTLPEPVDVIVSDLRGVLPLFRNHLATIKDARERFLRPGGVLIPASDSLWAAPVEAPASYLKVTQGYAPNNFALNLDPALRHTTNSLRKGNFGADSLLAEPKSWASIDYARGDQINYCAEVAWTVERAGTGHGLAIWFDSILAESVTMSNAPGRPELIYHQIFLPWSRPVELIKGDRVEVSLRADLVGPDYIWCWNSRVTEAEAPARLKADFKQSTFLAVPLVVSQLHKKADVHVASLNEDGLIDRAALILMDGRTKLGDIAHNIRTQFPSHFATWQDAMARVGEISAKYSRLK